MELQGPGENYRTGEHPLPCEPLATANDRPTQRRGGGGEQGHPRERTHRHRDEPRLRGRLGGGGTSEREEEGKAGRRQPVRTSHEASAKEGLNISRRDAEPQREPPCLSATLRL